MRFGRIELVADAPIAGSHSMTAHVVTAPISLTPATFTRIRARWARS